MRHLIAALPIAILGTLTACSVSVASLAATRALENGAADSLSSATSFEIKGTYTDSAAQWSIDLQLARPASQHLLVTGPVRLESIVVGEAAYFRGQEFLLKHIGSDEISQQKARSAGNSWWKGSATDVLRLPDFTDGSAFKSTFLGPVASRRMDNQSVDGIPAVELSGVRGDVFIAQAPPYQLLRVHLNRGVSVDGVTNADLRFSNFDHNFGITAPRDVINFSDLSTLPPIYYVTSIDTSGCTSPCALTAALKNIGGATGASAPSTVTFTVSDSASGRTVGGCTAQVVPDVGYNGTTSAGCTIGDLNGQQLNAAIVTVTVDNPGRA